MAETKEVTVCINTGGMGSAPAELIPGEDAEQLITLLAQEFKLPADGSYQLVGPDRKPITGDVYKAVKDGDKLTLYIMPY